MSYTKKYFIDTQQNQPLLKKLISEIVALGADDHKKAEQLLQKAITTNGEAVSKSGLYLAYKSMKEAGLVQLTLPEEHHFLSLIRMKHIRTLSGVTPVTVLTKPFPCPGKCIFCPNDVRMPKSYLSAEPGAQRAEANRFDPYFQTYNRLLAFKNMGHPTDKVELIILGGTWSSYPEFYQIWFVKRCFDALNDFGASSQPNMLTPPENQPFDEAILTEISKASSKKTYNQTVSKALSTKLAEARKESATWEELFVAHKVNETAKTRCVGLVIETRPDEINEEEVIRIRKLGATKVQIGIQSLNDKVLMLNKRGHDVAQTEKAIILLRKAGFKIHAHWMPNLYGSTPEQDCADFKKLFTNPSIMPDELKVYPCSLIQSAELMEYYEQNLWSPYSEADLVKVLTVVLSETPRYCRLTRIIRDIPSQDIVVGNKKTNFRQIAEQKALNSGVLFKDIRSREIRGEAISFEALHLKKTIYTTETSTEYFLEYVTADDKLAAFLRLSLQPMQAIIREVHVYGQSIELGTSSKDTVQHIGLGKKLMSEAQGIAKAAGYTHLKVISSVGTREYYRKNGFIDSGLYQEFRFNSIT